MAKRDESNPYFHDADKPHFVGIDEVENLTFEIFTIVWTSLNLKSTEVRRQFPPLVRLLERQAEARLSSCLLHLAILMRTLDEIAAGEPLYDKKRKEFDEQMQVGRIYDPAPDAIGTKRLLFREACSKIIHALDVRPTYDRGGPDEHWSLSGVVELAGEKNGKSWLVDINLYQFLQVCLGLVKVKPSTPPEE